MDDCQIKKAKRGSNMELVLKRTTAICSSPKKFKVELKGEDETILLEELKKKEEYERVSVKVKVLEVMDCATVPPGKKVQDVIVADLTCTARCTLWEMDIGQLEQGKSYNLKMFMVREYKSKNYLSKGQDSQIVEVEDIGNTVTYTPDVQENSTTIRSAEIVAVPELDKYKGCLRCKARVEPLDSGLGRCSKEDCQMLQKYDVCPEHLYAKLMLSSVSGLVSLYVYGPNSLGDGWRERW